MKSIATLFKDNNYYIVDEYQKNKILKLKYFEEQFDYIINLADSLERFLKYKLKKYKIELVKIEGFLR